MTDFAALVAELKDAALDAGATWDCCSDEFQKKLETRLHDAERALLAASPPPPAGAAGGGSGDLGPLSARLHKLAHLLWNDTNVPTEHSVEAMEIWKGLVASAPTPDLGAQGEPVACDVPDSVRRFIQHCEEKVYPLVTGCWALNRTQADAFIDALNAARSDLAAPAAPRTGSGVSVEEIEKLCDRLDRLNTISEPQACADVMDEARLMILALFAEAPRDGGATQGGPVDEDDAEIDRILALSEDEVRAELVADGHNPEELMRKQKLGLDGLLRLAADRTRWREEAGSWRRVAERLEEEKVGLREALRPFAAILANGEPVGPIPRGLLESKLTRQDLRRATKVFAAPTPPSGVETIRQDNEGATDA